jgi:CTP synthase
MVIFITGGVLSSLGKGITASTLGALLRARGLKVRLRKFDPYLNVDPGTMNPYEHGEVFVTDDGAEVDLDLGSYERFTGVSAEKQDSTTTGRLYLDVIEKERKGDYLGQTIQVIPHITDEIKNRMLQGLQDVDVMICEIGGTVGDIEGLPFLEAIRQLRHTLGPKKTLFMHLGWVPYFGSAGELKTKPLQHSVKELQRCGIQPDILVCRCDRPLPLDVRKKIGLFCNIDLEKVIEAKDVSTIYEAPLAYHEAGLDKAVCQYFQLEHLTADLTSWRDIAHAFAHPEHVVKVGIVGKYTRFPDAYRSLIEALHHGGLPAHIKVEIAFIDAEEVMASSSIKTLLGGLSGIIVPGGFGIRGAEGMVRAIGYARQEKIPFLGICFGMQLAVIESLRQIKGLEEASSSEFGETPHPVIALLKEWMDEDKQYLYSSRMGGTMRLGAYPCALDPESRIGSIYGQNLIHERHRHRYEVNGHYKGRFKEAGLRVSGVHTDLVETVERLDHPWFIATQFHPELKSRPFEPHPLFVSFVQAAYSYQTQP